LPLRFTTMSRRSADSTLRAKSWNFA
jgi:hypothetical protein